MSEYRGAIEDTKELAQAIAIYPERVFFKQERINTIVNEVVTVNGMSPMFREC